MNATNITFQSATKIIRIITGKRSTSCRSTNPLQLKTLGIVSNIETVQTLITRPARPTRA